MIVNETRDRDIAGKMSRLEKEHNLITGNVTICAKVNRELKVEGWVLPGGKLTKQKEFARSVGYMLNARLNNSSNYGSHRKAR